jgi:hypothetical protein
MDRPEPLLPEGWRWRRTGESLVATRVGSVGGPRLEWRAGPPPAYDHPDVEDEDEFELGDHRVGYRRLGHRFRGREVLSEEWTWRDGAATRVLTGTVPREDYLSVCELFEEVARSVELDP